jgi:hypothetical protein
VLSVLQNLAPIRPLAFADVQQQSQQQQQSSPQRLQQQMLMSSASAPDVRLQGGGPALAAALLAGPNAFDRTALLGETLHGHRFGQQSPARAIRPPPPPSLLPIDRSSPSLILLPGTTVPVPADSVTGQNAPATFPLMQGRP